MDRLLSTWPKSTLLLPGCGSLSLEIEKVQRQRPVGPYPTGARYDFELVPETAAEPTPPDVLAAHDAKIRASLEDAAKEIAAMNRAGLPWPRPRI